MVHSANNNSLININSLPNADNYFLAFSGGLDSSVLLHVLSKSHLIESKLTAIHVNHNINPESNQWADRCQDFCDRLGIPLITQSVEPADHSENACRLARQNVFKNIISAGDCLFTAHHQDDQVETILFRLARGTGINGMIGMAEHNTIDGYQVYRPLLTLNKAQLKQYADKHMVSYVEDPSNLDNQYSRNFIRNNIIPALREWNTDVSKNMTLTAKNLKNSNDLINHLIGNSNPLSIISFNQTGLLTSAIYHWLNILGIQAPNHNRIRQFAEDCIYAAVDKNPRLDLAECHLVRWNKTIYALNNLVPPNTSVIKDTLSNIHSIVLPNGGGILQLIADSSMSFEVEIKFDQRNETIMLDGHDHNKKIRNLFQELKTPPWERSYTPFIYINNKLMAVGSFILAADFNVLLNSHNAEYQWLSPQFIL